MSDITYDFELSGLKLSICIIDEHHKNLLNEVLGIMDYTKRQKEEIRVLYAVFNKYTNLQTKNKKIFLSI